MSTEQMRDYVEKAYPGDKWQKKVSRMSENQIIAVYYSILRKEKKNVKHK